MELPGPRPSLRTPRLVLRPFGPDDLEPLLVFHSDPDAVRYVPYTAARTAPPWRRCSNAKPRAPRSDGRVTSSSWP